MYAWRERHDYFNRALGVAERIAADRFAFETIEIADKSTNVGKAKLRIASRQWLAERLNERWNASRRVDIGDTTAALLFGRIERTIIPADAVRAMQRQALAKPRDEN